MSERADPPQEMQDPLLSTRRQEEDLEEGLRDVGVVRMVSLQQNLRGWGCAAQDEGRFDPSQGRWEEMSLSRGEADVPLYFLRYERGE